MKKHAYKLIVLLLLFLVCGVWLLRTHNGELHEFVDYAQHQLESLPAPLFFLAIGLLPMVGVPIVPLYILAGAVYGVWGGLLGMGGSLLVNFTLSYWVASRFLRSLVYRMVRRAGWNPPENPPVYPVRFTLLVRFTPGAPLMLQNYFLGLTQIPFKTFLVVSWLAEMVIAAGYIMTGKSLFSGQWGYLLAGVVLVILILLVAKTYYRKVIAREKSLHSPTSDKGEEGGC